MKNQVVVTGLGLITALGNDYMATWKKLCAGEHGIFDISTYKETNFRNLHAYKSKMAGVITDFDSHQYIDKKKLAFFDRAHQLAIVASLQAINDAGLINSNFNKQRAGIYLGTSVSGTISGQKYQYQKLHQQKINRCHIYNYPLSMCLKRLTNVTGFLGVKNLISTACTASTIAIATAVQAIRLNQADVILVGGVDPLAEFSFAGFNSMNNVSMQPCAPFSLPTGLTLGEGAGMMIIESHEHAVARGAKIYAEIAEYVMSADAWHITSPEPSGQNQRDLLLNLLSRSNEQISDIDYLNAHGTGTPGNDTIEAKGIQLAFKEHIEHLAVSSTKGATGHTLAAAGAIEAIFTTLAVHNDILPPTANFSSVREKCQLNHVSNFAKHQQVRAAITQNFAFGGNNAALLIRKPKPSVPKSPVNKRVVITGMGLLSPIGNGTVNFLQGVMNYELGIKDIERFDTASLRSKKGGLIDNFNPSQFTKMDTRRLDRFSAITVCASEMALKDAEFKVQRDNASSIGIILGSSLGAAESTYLFNEPIARGKITQLNPALFPNTVLNAGSGAAAINLRLKGPNIALNIGQASGLRAIACAYDFIRLGEVDAMIAGGVDEVMQFSYEAYNEVRQIAPLKGTLEISCPFDHYRNGMILGEGAAFFMLESLESALARGAKIYAEILGHDCCSTAKNYSEASQTILANCMQSALSQAQKSPEDIHYVSAGALSYKKEDYVEAQALIKLFGNYNTPVSAFSSVVGSSAATAPLSLAATVLGMHHQFAPAQLNYSNQDTDCALNIVTPDKNRYPINYSLINSISLEGIYTSMVVRKFTG